MKNRERLDAIKRVEPIIEHIKKCAKEIINDTYDYHVCDITEIEVCSDGVRLDTGGYSHGDTYFDRYVIPVEWFDEGFDYKSAYEELKRIEEENNRKRLEELIKKQKERTEKEEYDKYLELKKKYETKGEAK